MRVVVSLENRFRHSAEGGIWSQTGYAHAYWSRYLDVFDEVLVVARVEEGEVGSDWERVDGPRISFAALPAYRGPLQYLFAARRLTSVARRAVGLSDAVILRVPSPIAASIVPAMRRAIRPYALEVVGDPYDVYSAGAVEHPLRPLFRWWFTRQLRDQVAGAAAVAYVTGGALQRRYPAPPGAFATSYSSIHLRASARTPAPRTVARAAAAGPMHLVTVGSLAQMYKGVDVLLEAIRLGVGRGIDFRLLIVGDGRHRPELEERARSLGIAERVRFVGRVAAADLVAHLDAADVFVLASRSEGLPHAIIEAMARGLPSIGSTAGGIPELLLPEDLVAPGDHLALADKLCEVVADPERMARMSARNWEVSAQYLDEELRARRKVFYCELRDRTLTWLRLTAPGASREG